jgi:hypothetical protein
MFKTSSDYQTNLSLVEPAEFLLGGTVFPRGTIYVDKSRTKGWGKPYTFIHACDHSIV